MSSKSGNNHRARFVAILSTFFLVAVTAWFIGGCSSETQKSTEITNKETKTTEKTDADDDVHVKVDLPDTITIK